MAFSTYLMLCSKKVKVYCKKLCVVWIIWSTVCHLATKRDDNAQGYLPCMLPVGQRVKVFPSHSFLMCFMVVAFLSRSSWVSLQFDNLFLNHQQIYPLLIRGCHWLFLRCTELVSSCSSVSLEVKRRRGDLGSYSESHCCSMHVGDKTSEMASCVILPQL